MKAARLQVHGKGSKIRSVPGHFHSLDMITIYLEASGHGKSRKAPLFQSTREERPLTARQIFNLVRDYAARVGIDAGAARPHILWATMATNALDHGADIATCRKCWDTPASPPRGSMTAAPPGRKTARYLK
ncbi:MAG: hypothetical protein QOH96_3367 [Blastocatellia bacterium]|nr:hypothetical protein [Blastocatellia bacterium]